MLTSLFGDLSPPGDPSRPGDGRDHGFAATAIMETVATALNARGQMVDRHSRDLVVSGSPAQAIREHFADTRADLDTATSLITLIDPAGVWASAVIRALSDASGQPIERLHLRQHTTLRTLATIERTTLDRRHEDTLRIYHADVRAPGSENAEIPVALMERSQMTTVIVGALQPHAVDALLGGLHTAAMLPSWRCPNLLFMLPPNAAWIVGKIGAIAWPARLHVHVLSESMSGASSVWNAMLGVWNQVKAGPAWGHELVATLAGGAEYPIAAEWPEFAAGPGAVADLDGAAAERALASLGTVDGLLGCAIVDAHTGHVLASDRRAAAPIEIDTIGAAAARVLQAHREMAGGLGLAEPLEELVATAGARQMVIRSLARHPQLFIVALIDRRGADLAAARFQLTEVERALG